MIHQTTIKFYKAPKIGDYLDIMLVKCELGKSFNGYLEKGHIVWEDIKEGAEWRDYTPFMVIPRMFPIQELIDALTDKAVLPTTIQVETIAELSATKYHLEDMRKLVFREQESYEKKGQDE